MMLKFKSTPRSKSVVSRRVLGCAVESLERRSHLNGNINNISGEMRTTLRDAFSPSFRADLGNLMSTGYSSFSDNSGFERAFWELLRTKPGQGGRSSSSASGMDGNSGDGSRFFFGLNYGTNGSGSIGERLLSLKTWDPHPTVDDFPLRDRMTAASADARTLLAAANGLPANDDNQRYEFSTDVDSNLLYKKINNDNHRAFGWLAYAQGFQYENASYGVGSPAGSSPNDFITRLITEFDAWTANVVPGSNSNGYEYKYIPAGSSTPLSGRFEGDRLDAVERAVNFASIVPMIVESLASPMSPGFVTRLMYHTFLHGQYLAAQAANYPLASNASDEPDIGFNPHDHNKILQHGQALMYLGYAFPEFVAANAATGTSWLGAGRKTLFGSSGQPQNGEIARAFYNDGGTKEQSNQYQRRMLEGMLDTFLLDSFNGNATSGSGVAERWDDDSSLDFRNGSAMRFVDVLKAAQKNEYEMLNADGMRTAYGDGERQNGIGLPIYGDAVLFQNPNTSLLSGSVKTVEDNRGYPGIEKQLAFGRHGGETAGGSAIGNRGYANSAAEMKTGGEGVRDGGNFVVRSGRPGGANSSANINNKERQVFFRGGDPDGSPFADISSFGEGPHTHQDMLGIGMHGFGGELLIDPQDSGGKKYPQSGYHNLMTVTATTGGVPNETREYKSHRKYDPKVANSIDTRTIAGGRWDNDRVFQQNVKSRDYIQSTSWHNAWNTIGSYSPTGGANADVARSVWMLNNNTPSLSASDSLYGTTLIFDWGKSRSSSVNQDYKVYFNVAKNFGSVASGLSQTFSGVGTNGANANMKIETITAGLPNAGSYSGQTLSGVFSSQGSGVTTFVASGPQISGEVVFAHLITTSPNGVALPSFNSRWVQAINGQYALRLERIDAGNVTDTWVIPFTPGATVPSLRSAFSTNNFVDADRSKGVTTNTSNNALQNGGVGDYAQINSLNFGASTATSASVSVSTTGTAKISVRVGGVNGTQIGLISIANTGGAFQTFTASSLLAGYANGVRDLTFVVTESSAGDTVRLRSANFT